jgi:hypothetical protein
MKTIDEIQEEIMNEFIDTFGEEDIDYWNDITKKGLTDMVTNVDKVTITEHLGDFDVIDICFHITDDYEAKANYWITLERDEDEDCFRIR